MQKIYLDNAATSWPKPEEVYAAIDNFNRELGANPGRGTTNSTLAASKLLLDTRELVAALFHIDNPLRIAFTLNVTEALNVALYGILLPGDHLIISSMEHNAMARPAYALTEKGIEISIVPCNPNGRLDTNKLRRAIKKNTKMVGLLHASNVTGTIQPVEEVGHICRDAGLLFLLDTAQSAGCLPIDVHRQCIDILAFTGHKGLLGPQGTGGLYVRPGLELRPLKTGGTGSQSADIRQPNVMPDRLESGTLNTPGIVGLGAGIRFILAQGSEAIHARKQQLTDILLSGLQEIDKVKIYGLADRQASTAVISFNIEHLDASQVSFILDNEFGIVTRAGLHCAPLAHQTIGTLQQGTCRLSPGYFNTTCEMQSVITAIAKIATKY